MNDPAQPTTDSSSPLVSNQLTGREKEVVKTLLLDSFDAEGLSGFMTFLQDASDPRVSTFAGMITEFDGRFFKDKLTTFRQMANQERILHLVFLELARAKSTWKAQAGRLALHFAKKYDVHDDSVVSTIETLVLAETYDFTPDRNSLEGITSYEPFLDIDKLGQWVERVQRVVCKVKCGDKEGTGFLIDRNSILTCYHVVERHIEEGVPVKVMFDYFIPRGETSVKDRTWIDAYLTSPDSFSKYSKLEDEAKEDGDPDVSQLDFAVITLKSSLSGDRKFFPIDEFKLPPSYGAPILIAGHPSGSPMKFSMAAPGFERTSTRGARLIYKTSTEEGSSGSPVFDHNFNLIGLHHSRGQSNTASNEYDLNNRGIPLVHIAKSLSNVGPELLKKK